MAVSMNVQYKRIKHLVMGAEQDIEIMKKAPCFLIRSQYLYNLNLKIQELSEISDKLIELERISGKERDENQVPASDNRTDLTAEELSQYTGKNGNPAYVAINGIIYDVTNSAAWAAASHFGLTAGKDLTSEFASCHTGEHILNKLTVVGKLI